MLILTTECSWVQTSAHLDLALTWAPNNASCSFLLHSSCSYYTIVVYMRFGWYNVNILQCGWGPLALPPSSCLISHCVQSISQLLLWSSRFSLYLLLSLCSTWSKFYKHTYKVIFQEQLIRDNKQSNNTCKPYLQATKQITNEMVIAIRRWPCQTPQGSCTH